MGREGRRGSCCRARRRHRCHRLPPPLSRAGQVAALRNCHIMFNRRICSSARAHEHGTGAAEQGRPQEGRAGPSNQLHSLPTSTETLSSRVKACRRAQAAPGLRSRCTAAPRPVSCYPSVQDNCQRAARCQGRGTGSSVPAARAVPLWPASRQFNVALRSPHSADCCQTLWVICLCCSGAIGEGRASVQRQIAPGRLLRSLPASGTCDLRFGSA